MSDPQQQSDETTVSEVPNCPKCSGAMWDNRAGKRNPKAPDFKCRDKSCDGVVWPPRGAASTAGAATGETGALPPDGMPLCPICGGAMWDDRVSKRNPKAPDFKCRNKPKERGGPGCEGIIWPPRDGAPSPYPAPAPRRANAPPYGDAPPHDGPPPFDDAPPHDDDDLPF